MKNKIIFGLLISLAILTTGTIYLIVTNKITIFNSNSSEQTYVNIDGKEYEKITDIPSGDARTYTLITSVLLSEEEITNFTDEQITLVAIYEYAYDLELEQGTTETLLIDESNLENIVYNLFGIKNFKVVEGDYSKEVNGIMYNAVIEKNDEKFVVTYNFDILSELYPTDYFIYETLISEDGIFIKSVLNETTNSIISIKEKNHFMYIDSITHEDNNPSNVLNEVIFKGESYDSIYDINYLDIYKQTTNIIHNLEGKNYEEFTYEEMTSLALISKCYELFSEDYNYDFVITNEEIAETVLNLFGIEDYELKPGVYSKLSGQFVEEAIIVTQVGNNFYIEGLIFERGLGYPYNSFLRIQKSDDKIIVIYEIRYDDIGSETNIVLGQTNVYYEINEKGLLHIEKIDFVDY